MTWTDEHAKRLDDVLIPRLSELVKAITQGREAILREFSMRVPAELDRDADLVLSEAKNTLIAARDEVSRLTKWVSDLQSGMYVNCVYCGHR